MPDAPTGGAPAPTGTDGAPAPTDAAASADKTFTQADLDRIVSDRLARERGKFADYEDLKAKASQLDELSELNKTELQKANDRTAAAERKASQVEAELADARLRTTVSTVAAKLGIIDPEAAYKLLDRAVISFDAAGTPTNLEAVLTDLAKAKPYLVGARPGGGSGEGGPRGGQPPGKFDANAWLRDMAAAKQ